MEPRPRGGFRHGKLKPHRAFILGVVERQPDITMSELAAELLASKGVKIDPSNLSKFLIAQGLSLKKTLRAAEQDRPELAKARAEWKDARQPIMSQQSDRLIFIDETGTTTKMTRRRGRALKASRLNCKVPFGHWGTQTFVAGLRCEGLAARVSGGSSMFRVMGEVLARKAFLS